MRHTQNYREDKSISNYQIHNDNDNDRLTKHAGLIQQKNRSPAYGKPNNWYLHMALKQDPKKKKTNKNIEDFGAAFKPKPLLQFPWCYFLICQNHRTNLCFSRLDLAWYPSWWMVMANCWKISPQLRLNSIAQTHPVLWPGRDNTYLSHALPMHLWTSWSVLRDKNYTKF